MLSMSAFFLISKCLFPFYYQSWVIFCIVECCGWFGTGNFLLTAAFLERNRPAPKFLKRTFFLLIWKSFFWNHFFFPSNQNVLQFQNIFPGLNFWNISKKSINDIQTPFDCIKFIIMFLEQSMNSTFEVVDLHQMGVYLYLATRTKPNRFVAGI